MNQMFCVCVSVCVCDCVWSVNVCMYVCVIVCVWERERESVCACLTTNVCQIKSPI